MRNRPGVLGACLLALLLCGAAAAQNPQLRVTWEYTDPWGDLVSDTILIDDGATEPLVVEQAALGGTQVAWTLDGVDPTGHDPSPDVDFPVPPNPPGFRDGGFFNLGGPVDLVYSVTADGLNPGDPPRVSSCTLAVTVVDTTPPTIDSVDCNSAPDPTVTVDIGGEAEFVDATGDGRVVDFTPEVSDVCDAAPTVVFDPPSGTTFYAGDTPVLAIAMDASGNPNEFVFLVRISAPPGPDAPTMLPEPLFTEGTGNEVAWTITDAATLFTQVQISDSPTFATVLQSQRIDVTGADPETFTFTGLSDAVEYFYRVRGGFSAPLGTDVWGPWSNVVSSTQDDAAPEIVGADIVVEQESLDGTVILGATWHQTTRQDWEADSRVDVDIDSVPGDVLLAPLTPPVVDTIGDGSEVTSAVPGGVALNYFQATGNTVLAQIEHWIETTTNQDLMFAVYEATDLAGPWAGVYSDVVRIEAVGPAFYSSGPLAVEIQSGLYYAIGVSWTAGDVRWQDGAAGGFGIGTWVGDLGLPGASVPDPAGGPDATPTPQYQRLTTMDGYEATGTIQTPVVDPFPAVQQWGTLTFESDEPGDTLVTVDVLDAGGAVLLAGVASGTDLDAAGIDAATYPQLSLRATLASPSGITSPVLSSWTLGYDNGNPFGVYAIDTVDPDFPVASNDGTGKLTGVRSDGQLVTDAFPLGSTTVTWTAEDHFGPSFGAENPDNHTATFVQTVTVIDTTDPTVTVVPGGGITVVGPTHWLLEQDSLGGATLNYTVAVHDICDGAPLRTATPGPGAYLNLGSHMLYVTATDASGNRTTRTITVQVVDTTPPEVNPANPPPVITIYQPNPESMQPYTWADVVRGLQYRLGIPDLPGITPANIYDICDSNPTIIAHDGVSRTFVIGSNIIYWTVADASGNEGIVPQVLVIEPLKPEAGGLPH